MMYGMPLGSRKPTTPSAIWLTSVPPPMGTPVGVRKYDAIWVRHIKAALMENRFRLAQLPVAGLRSDAHGMYDLLVRMIDEQGNTVLPSDFLPAAERNNLMKTIDRWIVSAALEFCAENGFCDVRSPCEDTGFCDETALSWLSRHSQPLRRLPLGPSATGDRLTHEVGRRGLSGLFDTVTAEWAT